MSKRSGVCWTVLVRLAPGGIGSCNRPRGAVSAPRARRQLLVLRSSRPVLAAGLHQMRQRGPRLGRDHNDGEGAASGARLPAAGSRRGCRTNQHHPRLLVRLPQGHDFGESHFGRGEPRPAGWVALTRSAEMAVVKFVQGVWFVRQPPSGASVGSRSERTFAFRVRLLGRGRGPE
jgi:hypothetical protein